MCDQRNAKKGLFLEAKRDWGKSPLRCQNVPIFEKKGPFGFYNGCLRVIFHTPPDMPSKKACLEVNWGKIMQNSRLWGIFPVFVEGENRD